MSRRALWELKPENRFKPLSFSEKKHNINIHFLGRFPPDIPDHYAQTLKGQKVSFHHQGRRKTPLFGADVHDFRRGRP